VPSFITKEDGETRIKSTGTIRTVQLLYGQGHTHHNVRGLLTAEDASEIVLKSWRTKVLAGERPSAVGNRKSMLASMASDSFAVWDRDGQCYETLVDFSNAHQLFKYATLGDPFMNIFAPRVAEALDSMLSQGDCNIMFVAIMMFDFATRALSAVLFNAFTTYAVRTKHESFDTLGGLAETLLVLVSLSLLRELSQLVGTIRSEQPWWTYFLSGWNLTSLVLSATTIFCVLNFNSYKEDLELPDFNFDVVLAFTSFLYWVQLLEVVRYLHKSFSVLIYAMFESAKAMAPFLIIMCVFVVAFGTMFWILLHDTFPDDGRDAPFEDVGHSFLYTFLMVLGGFQIGWFMEKSPIALPVFLIFMLAMIIVALNVLIAIVSEAYEGAVTQGDMLFCVTRFEMLAEMYHTAGWLSRTSRSSRRPIVAFQVAFVVFVIVLTLPFSLPALAYRAWTGVAPWSAFNIGEVPETLMEGDSSGWSGRINFLKKELMTNTHSVIARIERLEKEKFDIIFGEHNALVEQNKVTRTRLDRVSKKLDKMTGGQDEVKTMVSDVAYAVRQLTSSSAINVGPSGSVRRSNSAEGHQPNRQNQRRTTYSMNRRFLDTGAASGFSL
jgi:hypothetical protein